MKHMDALFLASVAFVSSVSCANGQGAVTVAETNPPIVGIQNFRPICPQNAAALDDDARKTCEVGQKIVMAMEKDDRLRGTFPGIACWGEDCRGRVFVCGSDIKLMNGARISLQDIDKDIYLDGCMYLSHHVQHAMLGPHAPLSGVHIYRESTCWSTRVRLTAPSFVIFSSSKVTNTRGT